MDMLFVSAPMKLRYHDAVKSGPDSMPLYDTVYEIRRF
jgi:hypothetical protein